MAETGGIPPVTVRIGGEDHTIRANVEPDYTRRCAKWVDDRITEIKSQLGLIESHKAAILAALSITDEMFQARAQIEEVQDSTSRRAEALRLELENATDEVAGD
jgi:cell division protein ZapA